MELEETMRDHLDADSPFSLSVYRQRLERLRQLLDDVEEMAGLIASSICQTALKQLASTLKTNLATLSPFTRKAHVLSLPKALASKWKASERWFLAERNKLLQLINPTELSDQEIIRSLLGDIAACYYTSLNPSFIELKTELLNQLFQTYLASITQLLIQEQLTVRCFLCYSKEYLNGRILQLHRDLKQAGITVFDLWQEKDVDTLKYIENISTEKSDYVLVIGTLALKQFWDKEEGWLYQILSQLGYRKASENQGIIKLLYDGGNEISFPSFLIPQQKRDFRHGLSYYDNLFELLEERLLSRVSLEGATKLAAMRKEFLQYEKSIFEASSTEEVNKIEKAWQATQPKLAPKKLPSSSTHHIMTTLHKNITAILEEKEEKEKEDDNAFEEVYAIDQAALESQRAIKKIKIGNTFKDCLVVPAYPDGNCGFTAIRQALLSQQQTDLANQFYREKFIELLTTIYNDIHQYQRYQPYLENTLQADGAKDLADWKKKFKSSGYWLQEAHFQFISAYFKIQFHFYYLPIDTHQNVFETEPGYETIKENDNNNSIIVNLVHVKSGLHTQLNHFDTLLIEPNQKQSEEAAKLLVLDKNPTTNSIQTALTIKLTDISDDKKMPVLNEATLQFAKRGIKRTSAITWGIPSKNSQFIARKQIEGNFQKMIQQADKIVICPLSGMGGVGKTELAKAYANHASEGATPFNYFLVYWFNANEAASLEAEFRNHAKTLIASLRQQKEFQEALPPFLLRDLDFNRDKLEDIAQVLYATLEFYGKAVNQYWLFIFDDTQRQVIERFLSTGQATQGHILITTRESIWPKDNYQKIEMDVFEIEEALSFLKQQLPKEKRENHQQLAERLSYLPIALKQATATIQDKWENEGSHFTIDHYLKVFEQKEQELAYLGELTAEVPTNKNRRTVLTIWETSLAFANQKYSLASEVFKHCAYFAYRHIPQYLLTQKYSEIELKASLRALREISLISFASEAETFSIHPLMQEISQLKMVTSNKNSETVLQWIKSLFWKIESPNLKQDYLETALSMLAKACVYDKNRPETIENLESLISHILEVKKHYERLANANLTSLTHEAMMQLAWQVSNYYFLEEENRQEVRKWLEVTNQCAQKAGNALHVARSNCLVACLYEIEDKNMQALASIQQARDFYSLPDNKHLLLDQVTLLLVKGLLIARKDKTSAFEYYKKSQALLTQLQPYYPTIEEVWTYLDLASVTVNSEDKQQWLEGKQYYQQALVVLEQLYKQLIYKSSYVSAVLYNLIELCEKLEHNGEALQYKKYLNTILEQRQDKLAYHLQATLFLKENKPHKALEYIEKAISEGKSSTALLINKVYALYQLERYAEARKVIHQINPQYFQSLIPFLIEIGKKDSYYRWGSPEHILPYGHLHYGHSHRFRLLDIEGHGTHMSSIFNPTHKIEPTWNSFITDSEPQVTNEIRNLVEKSFQRVNERNGNHTISIILPNYQLANQLQKALKKAGVNGSLRKRYKINKIAPISNSNAQPTYSIKLTKTEYEKIMGSRSFEELLLAQESDKDAVEEDKDQQVKSFSP